MISKRQGCSLSPLGAQRRRGVVAGGLVAGVQQIAVAEVLDDVPPRVLPVVEDLGATAVVVAEVQLRVPVTGHVTRGDGAEARVVGLPVFETTALLRRAGIDVLLKTGRE